MKTVKAVTLWEDKDDLFLADNNVMMCPIQHQHKHEEKISPKWIFNTFEMKSCLICPQSETFIHKP